MHAFFIQVYCVYVITLPFAKCNKHLYFRVRSFRNNIIIIRIKTCKMCENYIITIQSLNGIKV